MSRGMVQSCGRRVQLLTLVLVWRFNTGQSGCVAAAFAPANRDELRQAVDACLQEDPVYGVCLNTVAANVSTGPMSTWDTGRVTSLFEMFRAKRHFNGNVSAWDVRRVTNMHGAFKGAWSFDGDLSSWNVASVTDLSQAFYHARSFTGTGLSAWNTASVNNMGSLFQRTDLFNGDVSAWDVSRVTKMAWLFSQARAFNGDLSRWNTGSCTDMQNVFSFTDAFNSDVSRWDTSRVTRMNELFSTAASFNGNLSSWNVANVESMFGMFWLAVAFEGTGLAGWSTANVKIMFGMFWGASSFDGDLSAWNVSRVENMYNMFEGASSFNQSAPLQAWDLRRLLWPQGSLYASADTSTVLTVELGNAMSAVSVPQERPTAWTILRVDDAATEAVIDSRMFEGSETVCSYDQVSFTDQTLDVPSVNFTWRSENDASTVETLCGIEVVEYDCIPRNRSYFESLGYVVHNRKPEGLKKLVYLDATPSIGDYNRNRSERVIYLAATKPSELGPVFCAPTYGAASSIVGGVGIIGSVGIACRGDGLAFEPFGCQLCGAGSYSDAVEDWPCRRCQPGHRSKAGAAQCDLCPAGTYQPRYGSSSCLTCGVGTFSDRPGATQCRNCNGGTYADEEGQSVCGRCGRNETQPQSGQAACDPKPAVQMEDGALTFFILLDSVQLVCTICCAIYVYRKRTHPIIRATSWKMSLVILCGVGLVPLSNVWFSLALTDVSNASRRKFCQLGVHMFVYGVTLFMAALVARNYRVLSVFLNPKLKKIDLLDWKLIVFVAVFSSFIALLMVIWSALYGVDTRINLYADDPHHTCTYDRNGGAALLYGVAGILATLCAVGSTIMVRIFGADIRRSEYDESKAIAFCFSFWVFILAVYAFVASYLEFNTSVTEAAFLHICQLFLTLCPLMGLFAARFFKIMMHDTKSVGRPRVVNTHSLGPTGTRTASGSGTSCEGGSMSGTASTYRQQQSTYPATSMTDAEVSNTHVNSTGDAGTENADGGDQESLVERYISDGTRRLSGKKLSKRKKKKTSKEAILGFVHAMAREEADHIAREQRDFQFCSDAAKKGHDQWLQNYRSRTDTPADVTPPPREKVCESGRTVNIGLEWAELDAEWKETQIRQYLAYVTPLYRAGEHLASLDEKNRVEVASHFLHEEWCESEKARNGGTVPPQTAHLFVPFPDLPAWQADQDRQVARLLLPHIMQEWGVESGAHTEAGSGNQGSVPASGSAPEISQPGIEMAEQQSPGAMAQMATEEEKDEQDEHGELLVSDAPTDAGKGARQGGAQATSLLTGATTPGKSGGPLGQEKGGDEADADRDKKRMKEIKKLIKTMPPKEDRSEDQNKEINRLKGEFAQLKALAGG